MDDGSADRATRPFGVRGYVSRIRLAASFLTILPLGPGRRMPPEAVAESFGYFPLVGFMLGAGLAIADLGLAFLFGSMLRSALVIMLAIAVTGALHLDALADTADALGGGADRVRALEIMRDSRIGAYGAVAIFLYLMLAWAALASLRGWYRAAALYLAPGLGRWAMVAVGTHMDYLRTAGAGSFVRSEQASANLRVADLTAAIALVPVLSWHALAAALITVGAAAAMRRFFRRWLGGVTGDLLGAAGALVELAVLIIMAARVPF